MKLDKLVKTLRRDLAANPLKAGVLGALLLGGTYFWGPLVWKWMGHKGSAAAPSAAAIDPEQVPSSAAEPGSGTGGMKETAISWREIRDQRKTDPLAQSADYRPEWDHAFRVAAVAPVSQPPTEQETKIQAKEEEKEKEVDPRDLGLVLQGVVISPTAKKAIINGRVYRERDLITLEQNADVTNAREVQQPNLEFRLLRVFRKMVELERRGKIWQLKLASTESMKTNPEKVNPTNQPEAEPPEETVAAPPEKAATPGKEPKQE